MFDRQKLTKYKYISKFINRAAEDRNNWIVQEVLSFLKKGQKIIDVGSGSCAIAKALIDKGYNVTPVDIENLSTIEGLDPIIYDGRKLPFKDNEFDVALLLTVLHHTKHPEEVLKETTRVAKSIIIKEDIYNSLFQKYATYLMDTLLNLEFFDHPHSNKNDQEWRGLFKKLGLKVAKVEQYTWWKLFLNANYFVKKELQVSKKLEKMK